MVEKQTPIDKENQNKLIFLEKTLNPILIFIDEIPLKEERTEDRDLIRFKGRDGKEYPDLASLRYADEEHERRMHPFIGLDGKPYGNIRDLEQADAEWFDRNFPKETNKYLLN